MWWWWNGEEGKEMKSVRVCRRALCSQRKAGYTRRVPLQRTGSHSRHLGTRHQAPTHTHMVLVRGGVHTPRVRAPQDGARPVPDVQPQQGCKRQQHRTGGAGHAVAVALHLWGCVCRRGGGTAQHGSPCHTGYTGCCLCQQVLSPYPHAAAPPSIPNTAQPCVAVCAPPPLTP